LTYKTQAYGALFGFPVDLDTDAKLTHAITTRSLIDFGDYVPNGGGTIVGKLVCNSDGSFTFEGLSGPQHFAADTDLDMLVAYWGIYSKVQEKRHEADKARWRIPLKAMPG
jgi:hypothetical protein